jgi:ornithine carbamoyltransferase
MIFQKPSTRTRVSFEVGMFQLGGTALYLGSNDIQLHRGETIADTARVLSRYVDAIMARVFAHQDIMDLAKHGSVPVINGLSDLLHPVQALADYYTLRERRGKLEGLKLAYVGDGNNVCHELILGATKLGMTIAVAAPAGYEPNPLILKSAIRDAQKARSPEPVVTADPMEAVADADVIYTDTWTSMGQEAEGEKRVSAFQGFMVSSEMLAAARPQCLFMHCLPAHRGEEVAAEVIDGPQSVVFDEAENRLHVQKALLLLLLGAA